jgi:hypothetical protein
MRAVAEAVAEHRAGHLQVTHGEHAGPKDAPAAALGGVRCRLGEAMGALNATHQITPAISGP